MVSFGFLKDGFACSRDDGTLVRFYNSLLLARGKSSDTSSWNTDPWQNLLRYVCKRSSTCCCSANGDTRSTQACNRVDVFLVVTVDVEADILYCVVAMLSVTPVCHFRCDDVPSIVLLPPRASSRYLISKRQEENLSSKGGVGLVFLQRAVFPPNVMSAQFSKNII